MLMITRTDSIIELGGANRRPIAFDVSRLASAMLCVERAPCGRVLQVLALMPDDGSPPRKIEGSKAELTALHETIGDMMREAATAQPVH